MCFFIDVLGTQLGVDDLLAGVESVVAREHIADGAGDGKVQKSFGAEQLDGQKDRSHGAVDHAAEQGDKTDGSGKARVDAQNGAGDTSESSADEEGRHDLAAFKAAADGDGGKEDLEQKCFGAGSAGDGGFHHIHAGAVIGGGTEQKGQRDDGNTACRGTQIGVGDPVFQFVMRSAHHHAEEDGKHGAQSGEQDDLQKDHRLQVRHEGKIKMDRVGAEQKRDEIGGEGRNDAGDQSRIVDDADADDLHRKEGSGQRGAEKGGENGAHTAHDHQMHILFVQTEPFANLRADGAAQLQGCAFPSGRAAAQMGQHSADEDQRRQRKGDLTVAMHRFEDLVGAKVLRGLEPAVQKGDDHAGNRQKVQKPGMRSSRFGGLFHRDVKGRADDAAQKSGNKGQKAPAEKGFDIMSGMGHFFG